MVKKNFPNSRKLADCNIYFKEYQDYAKNAIEKLFKLLKQVIPNKIKMEHNKIFIEDKDMKKDLWTIGLQDGYIRIDCYDAVDDDVVMETFFENTVEDVIDTLDTIIE